MIPERLSQVMARGRALLCLCAVLAITAESLSVRAALMAPSPGPIDRPLYMVSADFNRDGFDDLLIANYEAGTLTLLVNRGGAFVQASTSPFAVGLATFGSPTSGPLFLAVTDLNPEDVDSDGVANNVDNCPNVYNNTQDDLDNDQIGDACQLLDASGNNVDSDGDGKPDYDKNYDKSAPDRIGAALDNCPLFPNPPPNPPNPLQLGSTAKGADGLCGTTDDLRFLYGPDGLCGTADDLTDSHVGQACASSPDVAIIESLDGVSSGGLVRLRLNNGSGGFQAAPSKATSLGPAEGLFADFTGDGHPDLVVSQSAVDTLLFFPGQSNGLFGTQNAITAGDGPEGLAAGDFNGDGRIDLAVANRSAGTVGIYLNTGTALPTVADFPPFKTPTPQPTYLLSGRLDGDALDDLVVLEQGGSGSGAIEVFKAPLSASSTPLQTLMLAGTPGHRPRRGILKDLDRDGDLDLAVTDFTGGQVLVFDGLGDGTFAASPARTLTGLSSPAALAALDSPQAPGPPLPDLAVLGFTSDRIDRFQDPGALAFTPLTPDATTLVSSWANSSGMALMPADASVGIDIVLLHSSPPRIDTLSGLGTGFFRELPPLALSKVTTGTAMAVGDLRHDGLDDILVVDGPASQVTPVTALPSGVFVEGTPIAVDSGPSVATIGSLFPVTADYDRDGVPDILDNCPTRYNPPGCKVTDVALGCDVGFLCTDASKNPSDCAKVDPKTGQCDSDQNGIGDQCQTLSSTCDVVDTDSDQVSDYSPASLNPGDFDRDGVANGLDNCPTLANANQADANGNGIGDACEYPLNGTLCADVDADGVCDYDSTKVTPGVFAPAALDNCPSVYNPTVCSNALGTLCSIDADCPAGGSCAQPDNDGDHVGNACVIRAGLDNCPIIANTTQADEDGNGIGDACAEGVNDILSVSPAAGAVTVLTGDGSGTFRKAAVSPLSGLSNPSAALIGPFAISCPVLGLCTSKTTADILVAEKGVSGNFADDTLRVFVGDGVGGFTAAPAVAAQGDPDGLVSAIYQPVCSDPSSIGAPPAGLRVDDLNQATLVAAIEPNTSSLGVYLVSNKGLRPPPGHPAALPVAGGAPVDALFVDLNQDNIMDLVALSSGDGNPLTSNVSIYIGLGNGLFFTDPTLDPIGVPDGMTRMAAEQINAATDPTYPDLALYSAVDGAPFILTNTLNARADIDGSGRVDGYDLAVMARAFGAVRGEDFTIQADGTLLQSGSGAGRVVVGGGSAVVGCDLPQIEINSLTLAVTYLCDRTFNPESGFYGLPVDLNLDGIVDGKDLAILAASFGRRP
ncbi:MAG TPA: FG-GAP-like repeat-containing protein [Candidatus Polarisedimenticolia bacterium]|nr:FG-GAP-like repeat-containing protein [Candidatus Polarisedimenticolia bacterium]